MTRRSGGCKPLSPRFDISVSGRLALFGSVLRNEARPDSDVDMLVEFAPREKTSIASWRWWICSKTHWSTGLK